jgi:WD40 repeat protein
MRYSILLTLLLLCGVVVPVWPAAGQLPNPQTYNITKIALSGDGKIIAVTGRQLSDSSVEGGVAYPIDFFSTEPGELIKSISKILPSAAGMSLNHDGTLLAYVTATGDMDVLEVASEQIKQLTGCCGLEAGYTRWNPINDWVATFNSGAIQVVDARTGQSVARLPDSQNSGQVGAIAWSLDGQKLASTSAIEDSGIAHPYTIQIWDFTYKPAIDQPPYFRFGGGGGTALSWNAEGSQIASNMKGAVEIYDVSTGEKVYTLRTGRDKPVFDVAWSPVDDKIAAVDSEKISVWNGVTRELIREYPVNNAEPNLAWSPDGSHLYYGGTEGVYRDGLPLVQSIAEATAEATPAP